VRFLDYHVCMKIFTPSNGATLPSPSSPHYQLVRDLMPKLQLNASTLVDTYGPGAISISHFRDENRWSMGYKTRAQLVTALTAEPGTDMMPDAAQELLGIVDSQEFGLTFFPVYVADEDDSDVRKLTIMQVDTKAGHILGL